MSSLAGAIAQTLVNVDFGVGETSRRVGPAATGQRTNDFWNLFRHYSPRHVPGQPLVPDGRLDRLRLADGTESAVSVVVSNAPGVWANASGDPMWDTYLFAPNGSNIVVQVRALPPGRYHVHLYGHAEADAAPEQNAVFSLVTGTNRFGPMAASGASGWRAGMPMQEGVHCVVFRDVPVGTDGAVTVEVGPGPNGVAVLNGMQLYSKGTSPPRLAEAAPASQEARTNLLFREIRHEARLTATEARFDITVVAEAPGPGAARGTLFAGDLAIVGSELPAGWRVVREGREFRLFADATGTATSRFEVLARIDRREPWNELAFTGPAAAIGTLRVTPESADVEVQVRRGTASGSGPGNTVDAALGADGEVSLRWRNRAAEVARQTLVTVDTRSRAFLSPAALRQVTEFQYEILQGRLASVRIGLPRGHSLTRLEGAQVRDWRVTEAGGVPVLAVDFLEPVAKSTRLEVTCERTADTTGRVDLEPARPLEVQRESGTLGLVAEDLVLRVESAENLHQINAPEGQVAAFRFHGRPAVARARVDRLQPELSVESRIAARLDETRLVVRQRATVRVARAGVYGLELAVPPGFVATDVRGPGLEGWKVNGSRLDLAFPKRLLGEAAIDVDLERPWSAQGTRLDLQPVRVTGAVRETARAGVATAPGFRLKTTRVTGARETPAAVDGSEALAFRADQADWSAELAVERLAPRVVAEVFNLITIGDGLVGGSATIRFGIVNQGLQQLRVRLPAHWRNVEFTGPGIRRRDRQGDVWTLGLQDKVWDGYTLVISYDHQFDPRGATLDGAGAHALDVERETGFVAITAAAGLKLEPGTVAEPLRTIDPAELPDADRALITRPVLLAYRYAGNAFALPLSLTRHEELAVLDAVTDRIQLTTVLTEAGETLTRASFMVKNNDRQFQRFQLPSDAVLWGAYVNGEPVKVERDGDWHLVSLPRAANRDQAFAVDLKYAQKVGALGRFFPRTLALAAPATDIPSTYAEWEVLVPEGRRLSGFCGTMTPIPGTTYRLKDGWDAFVRVYRGWWLEYGGALIVLGGIGAFFGALVLSARRSGFGGITAVLVAFALLGILASMLLPALAKAKSKAVTIKAVNSLKQVGIAARVYATDNGDRLPPDLAAMAKEVGPAAINPHNGRPFVYLGANKSETDPNGILAYGETGENRFAVALVDGSVQQLNLAQFQEALVRSEGGPARAAQVAPEVMQRYGLKAGDDLATSVVPPAPRPALSSGGTSASATASGLRSIRLDMPRAGRAYQFTKVLNVGSEPLALRASLMRSRVRTAVRMLLELSAFLAGLGLVAWNWTRPEPRSWRIAAGLTLVGASAVSVFLAWRALHLALIWGLPVAVFLVIGNLVAAYRRHRRRGASPGPAAPPNATPGLPPAVAAGLVALWLLAGGGEPAARAATIASPEPAPLSLVSGTYTGVVANGVARLDARLEFLASATNQSLALFGPDVALQSFSCTNAATASQARLWREGDRVGIAVPQPGTWTARLRLLARAGGDVTRRQLEFAVPPALGSRWVLWLDQPDAEVECAEAVSLRTGPAESGTRVDLVLGPAERLTLRWAPRAKRAADASATIFADQTSVVSVGSGVANVRAAFRFQVAQGEVRHLRFRLPSDHRLLRVGGDAVRSWNTATNDPSELVVELLRTTSGEPVVTLETERLLGVLPSATRIELPRALDARRETGVVALRTGDDVTVTVEKSTGLQRMDASEFPKAALGEGPVSSDLLAFRFSRTDLDWVTRVEANQPELDVLARHRFGIGIERLTLSSHLAYEVRRLGTFRLEVLLPAAWNLDDVRCPAVQQWTVRESADGRIVDLALRQRTLGRIEVALDLSRTPSNLPPDLELVGAHPRGVRKLGGFVSVTAEPGVGTKTGTLEGMVEIPAAELGDVPAAAHGSLLTFKTIVPEPGPRPGWRLMVATEAVEAWTRAEVAHVVTVTETLVTGRSWVRYEIQNAPARTFSVQVPTTWRAVEIRGDGIRRRDGTNGLWNVELQNRVRGTYLLEVTWEEPRAQATNDWNLAGFLVPGVERETGFVAFLSRPPLQVSPGAISGDLSRIDVREWPGWTGLLAADDARLSSGAVLVWRYLRPGYSLGVGLQRFADAEVLQGLAEDAHLTTVVADDGQCITQLRVAVRHNGRQWLEMRLPDGATVWSAFVSGQPVRPRRREGRLLLPLEGSGDPDVPVPVELAYVEARRFPRATGRVELVSPRFDLPLKDARWDVYLPPEFEYDGFGGTMSHQLTDQVPLSQEFTLAEYRRQESASAEADVAEVRQVVERARSKLAGGRLADARDELGQLRARKSRSAAASKDVELLEQEVNRAQSSNFLQAQNAFRAANGAPVPPRADAPSKDRAQNQAPGPGAEDSAATAERQVAVVQKAQSITTARVQPLRVNLPTRGLRHRFTQVLQTDIDKPLVVSFDAASHRSGDGFRTVLLVACVFFVVWIAVSAVLLVRSEARTDSKRS